LTSSGQFAVFAIWFASNHYLVNFPPDFEQIRMLLANPYDTESSGGISILRDDLAPVEFYKSFVQNIR